jgi:capsular polysaccharide biosynthesis protein
MNVNRLLTINELPRNRIFGEACVRNTRESKQLSRLYGSSLDISILFTCRNASRKHGYLIPAAVLRARSELAFQTDLGTDTAPPQKIRNITLSRPTIFGGYLNTHYGHFITEVLSRLWLERPQEQTVLFTSLTDSHSGIYSPPDSPLPCFINSLLKALGYPEIIIVSPRETILVNNGEIIIPWPLFQTRYAVHPEYASLLQKIGGQLACNKIQAVRHKKIYFARSLLANCLRPLINEDAIIDVFREEGFTIAYPETMSIEEQVSIVSNSTIIAGFAGSALHNVVFSPFRKKMLILSCEKQVNSNFLLFQLARDDDVRYMFPPGIIKIPQNHPKTPKFEISTHSAQWIKESLATLGSTGFLD